MNNVTISIYVVGTYYYNIGNKRMLPMCYVLMII